MIFCCCCWFYNFCSVFCFAFREIFKFITDKFKRCLWHMCLCVYLIVWLTRLNCVGGNSDAGSDVNSSATNWQPNTGARTNTHIHIHTTPFCAYVFNLIFVNFNNNNNTFALPVFGYFKLVRFATYFVYFMFAYVDTHTH